jgi:hypothetical protein
VITTVNEFKSRINEMLNTDVSRAVWDFYKPDGRKFFLGSDGPVNHEFIDCEWDQLSGEVQQKIHTWFNNNPWLYTNLVGKSEWQEYINRDK